MTSTIQQTSKRHPWPAFVGSWPRLTGRQEPEFESRHEGDESEGDRCAQFGFNLEQRHRTKTRFMPWQWSTARGVLSLKPANEYGERVWTHRDVCIEATRQQGKTLLVVLLILFHLFVTPVIGRSRALKIMYTAQRWSTAKDVFDRVVKVINRVPALRRRLARPPSTRANHGVIEVVVKRDRQGKPIETAVCEFAPRSQEIGRGVTELDILFLDEAYDIDPGIENDLTGAQSASENPQTIYLSTPPVFLKHPKCHSLADMHRLGHARAKNLFYQLFAAPRHMKRDDPATWRAGQPSFDVATNEREIESKLQKARNSVKRAIFDADYCGWGDYPPPESEDDSEISAERWQAMGPKPGEPPPELVGPVALMLEQAPGSSGLWAIVAARRTRAGRVHLEIGYCDAAPAVEIVEHVTAAVAAFKPLGLGVRKGSGAAELLTDLTNAGIVATELSQVEVAQACGGFLLAALGGELSHRNQSGLNDGVSNAVKKNLPAGGFTWQLVDEASYAQLMGASCAHYLLVKLGFKPKRKVKPAYDPTPAETSRQPAGSSRWSSRDGLLDPMTASF